MGQGLGPQPAVDLPDPLEDPKGAVAGQSPAHTDDLLAEMASSQIDQMLAEAELERPLETAQTAADPNDAADVATAAVDAAARQIIEPLPAEPPATSAPEPDQTIEELDDAAAQQLDKLFDELQEADDPSAATPVTRPASAPPRIGPTPIAAQTGDVPSSAPLDPKVDAQLNALFAEIEAPPQPSPETSKAVSAALDPNEQTGRLEQQVLAEDAVLRATAMLTETPAPVEPQPSAPDREPVYVRVLAWVNAPLEWCSESARQAMGKVAIFTLLNAVAVLVYVLFFRGK